MRVPQISNRQRATCERDLARLRRLEERHRVRAVMTRGARGSVGFVAGLGVVIKTKIAATLAGKLAIAALFGIGFAWPIVIVWVAGIGIAVVAVMASLIGAYYYLRIVKLMYFDDPVDTAPLEARSDTRALLSINGLLRR